MGLFSGLFRKQNENSEAKSSVKPDFSTYGLIVFDTETTGLDLSNDEILQLSMIDENGNVLFDEYFKPKYRKSWPKASSINGITPSMVKDKPHFEDRKKEIQSLFDRTKIIVGYNINFDIDFLAASGISFRKKKLVDVMDEYSKCFGVGRTKLTKAAKTFGYHFEAHNSLEDVRATLFVHNKLNGGDAVSAAINKKAAASQRRVSHEDYLKHEIGGKTIAQIQEEQREEIVYRRFKPDTPKYSGLHIFCNTYPPREGYADLTNEEKLVFEAFSGLLEKEGLNVDKVRMVRYSNGGFVIDHPVCEVGRFRIKAKPVKYDIYPIGKDIRKRVAKSREEAEQLLYEYGEDYEIRERMTTPVCDMQLPLSKEPYYDQLTNITVDECIENLPKIISFIKKRSNNK